MQQNLDFVFKTLQHHNFQSIVKDGIPSIFDFIQNQISNGITSHSIIGLKFGTETEDMSDDFITLLQDLTHSLPMEHVIKIGGCEAKQDIRKAIHFKIPKILAPMIESAYALKLFVNTVYDLYPHYSGKLAINIETQNAVKHLDEILNQPEMNMIASITIGRSDLQASYLDKKNNLNINNIIQYILSKIKTLNNSIQIGIGGNVIPSQSQYLETLDIDFINTRHILLKKPFHGILYALELEILFYSLYFLKNKKPNWCMKRIEILVERMHA